MQIPEDAVVKARLLQVHAFNIGKIKRDPTRGVSTTNDVKLQITVTWIEQFGVLHMAWAAENGYGLDLGQAQIPARRIAFANDISFAGRMAVDWVVDLVAKFEACIKQLGSECPIEFHDHWVNRDWPK